MKSKHVLSHNDGHKYFHNRTKLNNPHSECLGGNLPYMPLRTGSKTILLLNIFLHDNTNMFLHSKRPDVQSQAGGGPPAQPPGPYQGHPGWGPQGPGAPGAPGVPGQPQPGYAYK
ncbi:hypothetical protein EMPG_12283 [Blastomyces silverae]|uniref:Uncharacterized protein n=1 Tax=Blastomyces silverae TaxID=2060906 RepID=A0A0H1BNN9_9EURO|nr:hypothetical protein EMPG_12283 [Blastomyces silverae]